MMKAATKFILTTSAVAILATTLFGAYSLSHYQAKEVQKEQQRLESSLKTFWQLLAHKGTDFRVVDGKLLVGTYLVNGNFELPDKVQEIFGGEATIFMGDERVATNLLDVQGKRALGTKLVGPAYDTVFKQGKAFRGAATILGVQYLTAYDPIKDNNGEVIGVLFVGVKEREVLARVAELSKHLALILSGVVLVFAIFMVILVRAMRRVEDANENQVRFQQTLINTIPSPVFYKDADCRYLGCNKAFEDYVGFSREQLIGKTAHELWPKELADCYLQQDLVLLGNPGTQVYEAAVKYADGSRREVIFNKATFEDGNGKVAGLIGVVLDITERKAAEEAIKSAYQQLSDIVEFLPDATFVVDRDKRVIAWNRAIEQMTGVMKRDILGKGDFAYSFPFYGERRPLLIDLLGPENEQERASRSYTQIKQDGQTIFTEILLPSFRDSGSRYLWATATPLFDKEGNPAGGIESIRDITEYKWIEEQKLQLESQLHHARMMESFMSRLGHDLRTPLTPLTVILPLIRKRVVDHELTNLVDICCKSTISLKKLADKAQLLGSLSARIKTDELQRINLVTVVNQSLADCEELLVQKDVAGRNEVEPSIVVQVVPGQLSELFANLITNAVHFSPENGVVRITAEQHNDTVTIAVHDDGVGLEQDHLEKVFDEFFKTDESRHDLDAPGLGLTICKRIVLNHQGRIWAESPGLGKGTTIKFTINEQSAENKKS